jgi:hypothetical protein
MRKASPFPSLSTLCRRLVLCAALSGALVSATVTRADTISMDPVVINVGKWAEGVVFDGDWLWVAESGQRTVARVDFGTGEVMERVKVGRLPTDMVSLGRNSVYALIATDRLVWQQDRNDRRKTLAKLGTECPEGMVADWPNLFVLTMPDCSSDTSRIFKIDSRTGKQSKSAVLGEWSTDLTAFAGNVWVTHANQPALTIVDQSTLQAEIVDLPGAELWSIEVNRNSVFAAGRVDGSESDGLVLMLDHNSLAEQARASVPELIQLMTMDDRHLIAVGEKGTIWVFSVTDLSLQREIRLNVGEYRASSVSLLDGLLLVSSSEHDGENGAVLVLDDWRP